MLGAILCVRFDYVKGNLEKICRRLHTFELKTNPPWKVVFRAGHVYYSGVSYGVLGDSSAGGAGASSDGESGALASGGDVSSSGGLGASSTGEAGSSATG
jgi:hypothetical protein